MTELSEPARVSGVAAGMADADGIDADTKAQVAHPMSKRRFMFSAWRALSRQGCKSPAPAEFHS
jgi:hypothetical protein